MKFIVCLLLLLTLAVLAEADTCGKNCPSNKCPSCPCGTTYKIENITQMCQNYTWSQTCCICIISQVSSASRGHMTYNDDGRGFAAFGMGVFDIWEGDLKNCGVSVSTACMGNPYGSYRSCAHSLYKLFGNTWKYWGKEAKQCGCPVGDNSPFERARASSQLEWFLRKISVKNDQSSALLIQGI